MAKRGTATTAPPRAGRAVIVFGLVALLAGGGFLAFRGGGGGGGSGGGAATVPTVAPSAAPQPQPLPSTLALSTGSCLAADGTVTACTAPHVSVVTGAITLPGDNAHPPAANTPQPGCTAVAARYLHTSGTPVGTRRGDPTATLYTGNLIIPEAGWRAGDHQLVCVVGFRDAARRQVTWSGPLEFDPA